MLGSDDVGMGKNVPRGSAAAIQCPMFSMIYEAAQAICNWILAFARDMTLIMRMSVPSKDTGMK